MNNERDFNRILDECLDRVIRGEGIEACIADYPEQAAELRPLLEAAAGLQSTRFTPSADSRRQARLRFHQALDKRRQKPVWARVPAWAAAAVGVVLLAVAGLAGLNVINPPGDDPPTIIVSAPASGDAVNFRFLVSDAPNDIGDFSSLVVTVDRVALLKKGADGEAWVAFTPEVKQFDLTQLIGAASRQLWQGEVPEGEYTKVELIASSVKGTLKSGETIDIKLPSNKLQIGIPFTVGAGTVTSFTFDITVNKTGQGSGKYILSPQAAESGAAYEKKP
ncbi:DUF4382 domain-containing protein [Dehalogenimonas alkenigignens]|uniref:DUF4382 domain-containing protein n=1 Tax=Dehalogenimonas alkenigignens TaxID=1217799 RepID=UPI000D5640FC|nr:DUF4382 domain-containing protein [Dehalogenimonas alkenigignens]PVV83706.1 hypothetical protein DD509_05605 [Dehalogenimonas alkenigignens]